MPLWLALSLWFALLIGLTVAISWQAVKHSKQRQGAASTKEGSRV
jgi:hypothetical protein